MTISTIDPKANYMIVAREASKREAKYYEHTMRRAVRHAKFIEKFGTAQSVCVISLKVPGKVAFYTVAGHPEKREEVKRARDIQ
jgi:hypothetical protein